MAINAFDETVMKLAEAGRKCPGGPVSPPTVYRWSKQGIEGVRLETLNIGGVCHTSAEALQRFFEAVTAAKESQAHTSDGEVADRSERTAQELQELGLA